MARIKSALAKTKKTNSTDIKKRVARSTAASTPVPPSTTSTNNSQAPTPNITEFASAVYKKCKEIPRGRVSTYKDIAVALDKPKACRAVGSALKRNPFAPIVPCHRVVASDRSLGGFFGSTDLSGSLLQKKREMLKEETVKFEEGGKVSADSLHTFK